MGSGLVPFVGVCLLCDCFCLHSKWRRRLRINYFSFKIKSLLYSSPFTEIKESLKFYSNTDYDVPTKYLNLKKIYLICKSDRNKKYIFYCTLSRN